MAEVRARLETAHHILHHILAEEYEAKQTGMQIYDDKIRLDVKTVMDLTLLSREELENKVNKIIRENLDVTIKTYPKNMVPREIDINGVPARVDDIRIVSIGDYDTQPCGNRHVGNTSEIGIYKILSIRRNGREVYSIQGTVLGDAA